MWQLLLFIVLLVITTIAVYKGSNRAFLPSLAIGIIISSIFLIVVLPGPTLKGPGLCSVLLTGVLSVSVIAIVILCAYFALNAQRRNQVMILTDGLDD